MIVEPPLLSVIGLRGLEESTRDDFVAGSHFVPGGPVYGGQVLAQAALAAGATVGRGRRANSLHAYFLRAGEHDEPIKFAVERTHDGRSFSSRRVLATQRGRTIFTALVSFHVPEPGPDHQAGIPVGLPLPDDLDRRAEIAGYTGDHGPTVERYLDIRDVPKSIYRRSPGGAPASAAWIKVDASLPDDPDLHRALLAYLSDATVQDPVLLPMDRGWNTPGLHLASLDHAMRWYADGRVDEWILSVQESPVARAGRGTGEARFYSRAGELLAVASQEILIRTAG